jgi:hypothetical protein
MSAGKNNLLISNEVVAFKVRQPQLCFVLVVTALELSFIFDNHSQYTLHDPAHCKPNGQLCFVKQCRIKKIVKNANVLVEYWNKHIKLYIFFVNNSISFGLLYRLFITRRFYPLMLLVEGSYDCCYIQIQAYILTTCEPRKTEGGDIIQGKSKCDL